LGQRLRESQWAYMAGFLDGDGTINFEKRSPTNTVIKVGWCQSEPNLFVLRQIEEWLDKEYIRWGIHSWEAKSGITSQWLRIYNQADQRLALEGMWPYVIRKAPEAKKALSFLGSNLKVDWAGMDWDYLAGFTDSDGCINDQTLRGYKQYRIHWTQKYEESFVLDEIKWFLEGQGIGVTEARVSSNRSGRQIIASQKKTRFLLEKMYSHLIVKKKRAKMVMDYLREVEELKEQHGRNYRQGVRREVFV
jgi:hypothetical protein